MMVINDEFQKHPDEFLPIDTIWPNVQQTLVFRGYQPLQKKAFLKVILTQIPDQYSQHSKINIMYRLRITVPKTLQRQFEKTGSAKFDSNGCITEYKDNSLLLGEPDDTIISEYFLNNLSEIEEMETEEQIINGFLELRKGTGAKDVQYLAERFCEVLENMEEDQENSKEIRERIRKIKELFGEKNDETTTFTRPEASTSHETQPGNFCYRTLSSCTIVNRFELSDYLSFLEELSKETLSPMSNAEIASAYKESRKMAEFRVDNILQKTAAFNEYIQIVTDISKTSRIRMLFVTQTPCTSFKELGYRTSELLLDNMKKVVEFKPKCGTYHLHRETFLINRTSHQISVNPLPWSTQEVDALFQHIYFELEKTNVYLSLKRLCEMLKTSSGTHRTVEQLYNKATEYLSTDNYYMGSGVSFLQKLSILHRLQIPLNRKFIEQSLMDKSIFQLNNRNQLVFASYAGTCIGNLNERGCTNLRAIQLNLLEIIRCLSLKTMGILSNLNIMPVYRNSNRMSTIRDLELQNEINVVRNLFESWYECSIFTRMHTLFVTQASVTEEFSQLLTDYDVTILANRKITRYVANNICVNFDRINRSWIEEVESADPRQEIQENSMFETFHYANNNINGEIMESLKMLAKTSLGAFADDDIFKMLKNKTGGRYSREKFNDGLEEFKSSIENSRHLGPLTQLRLLFMTCTPVSQKFLQTYGTKYIIEVDNQQMIVKFKAVVCLTLSRNEGIRMEEYKVSTSDHCFDGAGFEQPLKDETRSSADPMLSMEIKSEDPANDDQHYRISSRNSNHSIMDQNLSGSSENQAGKQKAQRPELEKEIKVEEPDNYEKPGASSEVSRTSSINPIPSPEKSRFGPTGLNVTKRSLLKRGGTPTNAEVEAKKRKSGSSTHGQTSSEEEHVRDVPDSQMIPASDAPTSSTTPLPYTSAKNILLTLRTSVAVLRMEEFSDFEGRITETIENIKEDKVQIDTVISTLGRTLSMAMYPLKVAKAEKDSMLVSKAVSVLIYVSFSLKKHFAEFPALAAIVAEIEKAEKSLESSNKRISIEEVKFAFQNWIMVLEDST